MNRRNQKPNLRSEQQCAVNNIIYNSKHNVLPRVLLLDGEPELLRFAGLKLDVVLTLLLGLDAEPPDREVSVCSLLLFVARVLVLESAVTNIAVPGTACSPSPSLESSLESPVNGMDLI